jgi:hypothetical protein
MSHKARIDEVSINLKHCSKNREDSDYDIDSKPENDSQKPELKVTSFQ